MCTGSDLCVYWNNMDFCLITFNSQTSCTLFLYIYAGSPSVISVTFNAQSNSFTCISSGGSARSITWRRNGVVITPNATHHQTQRVMDTTTSTYQSELTIDTSMNQNAIMGTFSCTVQNARGTSSRMLVVTGEIWHPDIHFSLSLFTAYHHTHLTLCPPPFLPIRFSYKYGWGL